MKLTDHKDPEEVVDATFDFTKDLGAEVITGGSPTVTIALVSGADPDPGNMLQGGPTLQGNVVYQRLRNGVDRAAYRLRCKVTTNGGRTLVLSMQVPVRIL